MRDLAMYTAVYPGVEPYLRDWYRSVETQTDRDFVLWISVDGLSVDAVSAAIGSKPAATWVTSKKGDTPAAVRQRGLEKVLQSFDRIVLVDSDDILCPTRVEAAREALESTDVYACALRLVDRVGRDLGKTMTLPSGLSPADVLPSGNICGLSNTAYRRDALRRCLRIPSTAFAPDWYLATKAWLNGASMMFDPEPRMLYRRDGRNMVVVGPPYTAEQVSRDTDRVLEHFRLILSEAGEVQSSARFEMLVRALRDTESFFQFVVLSPPALSDYVRRLNDITESSTWWGHVAAPMLREMWSSP